MKRINILRISIVYLAFLIILCYIGDIVVITSVFNIYDPVTKIYFSTGLVFVPVLLLVITAVFSKNFWINRIMIVIGICLVVINFAVLTSQVGYIE